MKGEGKAPCEASPFPNRITAVAEYKKGISVSQYIIRWAGLLAFLKQQVMVSAQCHSGVSSTSVGVKAPTCFFPFFDCFSDVVVVSY
jgi:hypothetical protein